MQATSQDEPRGVLSIRTIAMPSNTNAYGDIFGGWLVCMMDMAAQIEGQRRAQCRVVTAAINSLVFIKPVYVGDTVCCYADLHRVGKTSMQFKIEVWTLALGQEGRKKVAEGEFTFVAIDEAGKPQPVDR